MSQYQSSTRIKFRRKHPKRYWVIMHNDDFTTMEFVIDVLVTIFFKSREEAERLMWAVHRKGRAEVGVYSLDVAMSKVKKATERARLEGFPFMLTMEPYEELPF